MEALRADHPCACSPFVVVSEGCKSAIFETLRLGPSKKKSVWKERLAALDSIIARHAVAEEALHASMDPHVRKIMKGKKLYALRDVLRAIGYPDVALWKDLARGLDVIGSLPVTGAFPRRPKPATLSVHDLMRGAKTAQAAVSSSNAKMTQEVLDEVRARSEAEAGEDVAWLRGPFTQAEVTRQLGRLWVPVRRFGIFQGGKIRLIDDASEFGPNATVYVYEKVDLGGIDEVVAIVCAWRTAILDDGTVSVPMCDGSIMACELAEEWRRQGTGALLGRTADLKAAYKQVAKNPAHRWASVVTVPGAAGEAPRFYISDTLLFGEAAAVYGFNRVSRALRAILTSWLGCALSAYFDDFPHLEFEDLAEDARVAVSTTLDKLGWQLATEEKKDKPFCSSFSVLGVEVDLARFQDGHLNVMPKADRVDGIVQAAGQALDTMWFPPPSAAVIAGRLQFLQSSLSGKVGCMVMHALRQRAAGKDPGPRLVQGTSLTEGLVWIVRCLKRVPPRDVAMCTTRRPVLIFTDGACEEDDGRGVVTVGAVLVLDGSAKFFGLEVPQEVARSWRAGLSWQVVGQAELFPVYLARRVWAEEIRGRDVLWFIDNDSARHALVKGYSPVLQSCEILSRAAEADAGLGVRNWYARVPTFSNIGDLPSRLRFDELKRLLPAAEETTVCPASHW